MWPAKQKFGPALPRRGVGRVAVGKDQAVALEAGLFERALENVQSAGVVGRNARAADEIARQGQGFWQTAGCHVRSNSLMDVLARVFSSTFFTITAQ